jgi:hypothetical protein
VDSKSAKISLDLYYVKSALKLVGKLKNATTAINYFAKGALRTGYK